MQATVAAKLIQNHRQPLCTFIINQRLLLTHIVTKTVFLKFLGTIIEHDRYDITNHHQPFACE